MKVRGCPKSHEMTEGYPRFLETQIFFQIQRGRLFPMNLKIRSFGIPSLLYNVVAYYNGFFLNSLYFIV